jgi:hypothetical protein
MFTLQGVGPYPVLTVQGGTGSAKSTLTKILRRLIDPVLGDGGGLLRPPRNEESLRVHAFNNYLVPYDNLSGLRPEIADALCSLATGGDFGGRKLYHDNELATCSLMRPVVLNGIDDILTRDDLADRSLWINMPDLPRYQKVIAAEFWADFDRDAPAIFGALLDALSATMAQAATHVPGRGTEFRMGDFAEFLMHAEKSLGWERGDGEAAYRRNLRNAATRGIVRDRLAQKIIGLLSSQPTWTGRVSDLLLTISAAGDLEGIPSSPEALGKKYDRLKPVLAKVGIDLKRSENAMGSQWMISRRAPVAVLAGSSSFLEQKEVKRDAAHHLPACDQNEIDLPQPQQTTGAEVHQGRYSYLEACIVTGDQDFELARPLTTSKGGRA